MERFTKKSPCLVPIISSSNHSVFCTNSSLTSNTFSIPILSNELLKRFLINSLTTSFGKKSNSPSSKIQSTISLSESKASIHNFLIKSACSSANQVGFSSYIILIISIPKSPCICSSLDVASTTFETPLSMFLCLLKAIIIKN